MLLRSLLKLAEASDELYYSFTVSVKMYRDIILKY